MINRSQNLTIFTILIGSILLSIGFNIILLDKIRHFEYASPVSDTELKELRKEIERLSNIKYDLKTKKMIDDFEIHTK